jgi:hypothetical protein
MEVLMPDPLLPRTVGLGLAAIMLGRSPDKLRELIDAGSVRTVTVGKRQQVPLAEIEARIGQSLTPAMFLFAERQLDRGRV